MNAAAIPAVSIKDLTMAYDHTPVLWDIDLELPQGVLCAIVGPNGAGKTTLLKAILGLEKPAAGKIEILGQSVNVQRKSIGYVPQRSSVDWDFPVNVLDVVLMGTYGHLGLFRWPGRRSRQDAMTALEQVGMAEFSDRHIRELSGGQQQRVFLARALVQDATIYFMDEPFVGVDAVTETMIVDILKVLRDQGKTVVVVHHDLQKLKEYFDWMLLLNVRNIAFGPVKSVLTTNHLKLAYGGRSADINPELF